MKRLPLLLLLLSLTLPGTVNATDAIPPGAPTIASPPVQAIDLRGLSLALLFSVTTSNDLTPCMGSPTVVSDLRRAIQQDLEYFGRWKSKTVLAEAKVFSAEEKGAAARLVGFVPTRPEGLDEEASRRQEPVTAALKSAYGEASDAARKDALRREASDLRERLKTGQLKASQEDLRAACLGVSSAALSQDKGPMVEMYRSYIKELTAEYTAYRSTEGYLAARWGMTPAEVAKAEGLHVAGLKSGKVVRIDGYSAKVIYQFTDGRLSEVVLTFAPGCKALVCLNRYRNVNNLLVQKYGKGEDHTSTDDQSLAETSSILYEEMGRERHPWMLIEDGYRKEQHRWRTDESLIIHQLYSRRKPLQQGGPDLVHNVRYISNKFLPRAEYLRRQQEEVKQKKRLQSL